MKYAIVFAVVVATYSLAQCYPYFTRGAVGSAWVALYCRVSYLHFLPRAFSPVDFVVHLLLWIIVAVLLWRGYARYIKERLPL